MSVPEPIHPYLTPEHLEAMQQADLAYAGILLTNASQFAGRLGLSDSAAQEFVDGLAEATADLDFMRKKLLAEHMIAIADAIGRTEKPYVELVPYEPASNEPIEIDTDSPQNEDAAEDSEILDAPSLPDIELTSEGYVDPYLVKLAGQLPDHDPELEDIDPKVIDLQNKLLEETFGERLAHIAVRLPLAARQKLMDHFMNAYLQMPIRRATPADKQRRRMQVNALFAGRNLNEIADEHGLANRNAIKLGLIDLTKYFRDPRYLAAVELNPEESLTSVITEYCNDWQVPQKDSQTDNRLDSNTDADDQLELTTGSRFDQILSALHITSKAEAAAFVRIFETSLTQPPYDEDARDIRETLQIIVKSVLEFESDTHLRLSELEANILWGVIGRPEPRPTAPRGVASLRKQYSADLSRQKSKIEEVIDRGLAKVADSRARMLQQQSTGIV